MTKISIRFYNDREVRAVWSNNNYKVPNSKIQRAKMALWNGTK